MLRTTVGNILVNHALPPDMRDFSGSRILDKKGVQTLFDELARRHPEQYAAVAKRLTDVARKVAYHTGGFSFSLEHMRPTQAGEAIRSRVEKEVEAVLMRPKLSDDEREQQITGILQAASREAEGKVFDESEAEGNPLAHQVKNVGRGNKSSLKGIRAGDYLYEDHRGRPIPVPALRSYAQGLHPVEYWAAAFGARQGVVATKQATQQSGYLGKQLVQATHRLVVTGLDAEDDADDSAAPRGLPVDAADPHNEGALLARVTGPYPRNTVLTSKILGHLQALGHDRLLIRSPLVGGPADGGVYGRDVGVRERGVIAPRGDYVGIAASQALCLAGGTEVRMADGTTKRIEDIVVGDLVFGCSAEGTVRAVRVVRAYANGVKPCWRTTFRLGTGNVRPENRLEVISTLDHKLLSVVVPNRARDGQRRPLPVVRRIERPNSMWDRYYAKMSSDFDDDGYVSEPFALLCGLLIGNGCYTGKIGSNGIQLSCWDKALLDDIRDYVASFGLDFVPLRAKGQYRLVDRDRFRLLKTLDGTRVRNRFRGFLLNHGIWGQTSKEKVLPQEVAWWDNASVAALLAGLFATDGCVHLTQEGRVSVGYSSSSRELIYAVRFLLQVRFGIYGSGVQAGIKKRPSGGEYDPNYRFTINSWDSVHRFASVIHPPGRKCGWLAATTVFWGRSKKAAEAGRCAFVEQVSIGELPTYDIEVDHPDHLFLLANGLVVSNSEKTTQSMLSSKHQGGVAGGSPSVGGFKAINQLVQTPRVYPGAAHAQLDGRVSRIEPAPQGGTYVEVAGQRHHIAAGLSPVVKQGDDVEAGDVLSDGLPNPAEVVRHKGIGDGRAYFVKAFGDVFKASGLGAHRRNIELLARGLINHVRLVDEVGDHVPDDIVPYQTLEATWEPRVGARELPAKSAIGKYLEKPVLHYTIGTPVRPSMLAQLDRFGVKSLLVHDEPPPFEPEMIRGMATLQHDPDWMTRHLGSNLQRSTLEAAHRGDASDVAGSSYVPAIAERTTFGRQGLTRGWEPRDVRRDGDGDGRVGDGTPNEAPVQRRSILSKL